MKKVLKKRITIPDTVDPDFAGSNDDLWRGLQNDYVDFMKKYSAVTILQDYERLHGVLCFRSMLIGAREDMTILTRILFKSITIIILM